MSKQSVSMNVLNAGDQNRAPPQSIEDKLRIKTMEVSDLSRRLDQLDTQRHIDAESVQILSKQNTQLRQEVNEKKLQIDGQNSQMKELKDLVMLQSAQLQVLNAQIIDLKNEVHNLRGSADAVKGEKSGPISEDSKDNK